MRPLPVTIVSGSAGAGKTALIDSVFARRNGACIAVINCPSSGAVLGDRLARVAATERHQYLFVELAADQPPPLLDLFGSVAFVDNRITVVDAATWATGKAPATVERAQIESADLLVINKCDRVTRMDLGSIEAALAAMNPTAWMIRSIRGCIPPSVLLGLDPSSPAKDDHATSTLGPPARASLGSLLCAMAIAAGLVVALSAGVSDLPRTVAADMAMAHPSAATQPVWSNGWPPRAGRALKIPARPQPLRGAAKITCSHLDAAEEDQDAHSIDRRPVDRDCSAGNGAAAAAGRVESRAARSRLPER